MPTLPPSGDSVRIKNLEHALVEAHHRVKNTIQNIISYINVMFVGRETISKDEMKKLSRYLHSLSSIHDLLLAEVKTYGNEHTIRLDRIIGDLIQVISVEHEVHCEYIPPMYSTARQAATLSLVLSELLDNATRHGTSTPNVAIESVEDPSGVVISAVITVTNNHDHKTAQIQPSNGMRVVELLSKSELKCTPSVVITDSTYTVRLPFTIMVE